MNSQSLLHFLPEVIPKLIYVKIYHPGKNCSKYAVGCKNSMIDNEDGHIPSALIMFTCTTLCHTLLQCQRNTCLHPKGSKSKLKEDRGDDSNYFNMRNYSDKKTSCCAATERK
jgi:hypothetical protein